MVEENKKDIIDVEVVEEPSQSLAVLSQKDLMSLSSHEGSLEAYLKRISKIPLLSREDEIEYARRYRENKDMQAAQYLILSNLRFVVYVAKGFKNYGLPLADLIQEGNVGLMKAVTKFDPDQNVRFISYAVYWIRCDINEYVIKNMRIVRSVTSKNRRKLLYNLNKHLGKKEFLTHKEREGLAKEYGVTVEDIEVVEGALTQHDSSTDFQNAWGVSTMEMLPDKRQSPSQAFEETKREEQHKGLVSKMLDKLSLRQREIIEARWLAQKKTSLEQLAKKYQVSMQRVSQIEKQALDKCKELGIQFDELLLEE